MAIPVYGAVINCTLCPIYRVLYMSARQAELQKKKTPKYTTLRRRRMHRHQSPQRSALRGTKQGITWIQNLTTGACPRARDLHSHLYTQLRQSSTRETQLCPLAGSSAADVRGRTG
ncbi:hypothetical protein GDO78_015124 [Eleutherodactylus coqui]|uniref:Uncharacterized protein n=1 Tax=Eleutherodactylus coqui TaxID=57060 RepID=A0A8J6BKT3_ELECQ|nr:hypothetical protein GDO78_015124 [Eleutherodactylus coqui]